MNHKRFFYLLKLYSSNLLGKSLSRKAGVVLMATVLIMTLLTVLVVQFSYSTLLDRMSCAHQQEFLQRELLLESVAQFCILYGQKALQATDFTEETVETEIEGIKVKMKIYDESGKFNLNSIAQQTIPIDRNEKIAQLQKLLSLIAETTPEVALYSDSIVSFMEKNQLPLGSVQELERASESTPISDKAFTALRKYLSVTEDQRINARTAPAEVIQALIPNLSKEMVTQVRQYLITRQGSAAIRNLARPAERFIVLTSSSLGADVEIQSLSGKVQAIYRFQRGQNQKITLRSLERVDDKPVENTVGQ